MKVLIMKEIMEVEVVLIKNIVSEIDDNNTTDNLSDFLFRIFWKKSG